jgi:hypothetical protein
MKTPAKNPYVSVTKLLCFAILFLQPISARSQAINEVLSLDGISGYASIPNAEDLNLTSGDFTITAWLLLRNYDTWNSAILAKRATGSRNGWMLNVGGLVQGAEARKVQLIVSQQTDARVTSKSDIGTNQWQHVAVAYSSATSLASIYVNGAFEASAVIPSPLPTTALAMLGRDSITNQYFWNGQLDEICVWGRALTPDELLSGLSCSRSGSEPGLLAYWNFDTGSVKYLTGYGHDGTLAGGAVITPISGGDAVHSGCANPLLDIQVSQVNVCWDSVTAKWYQLQYRSDLTTNAWVNLGGLLLGTGARICIADDVADQPRRYYRAVVAP